MAVDDFSHLPALIKSPALIAIENDDVEALRQLLEEGLDPNSAAYLEDINSKPLLWKTHCKPRMIRLLLEYGADQEITHRTNRGRMTFGEKTDASIASMKASKDDPSLVHYERDMKCLIAMKQALSN